MTIIGLETIEDVSKLVSVMTFANRLLVICPNERFMHMLSQHFYEYISSKIVIFF
jgi:hypothetical protein